MVLGFSTRSRKTKDSDEEDFHVRMSPSLPQMSAQGLSWPTNLVDINEVREQSQSPTSPRTAGPAKVSFTYSDQGAIPFHKPFRVASSEGKDALAPIASLYMSPRPPSAYMARQSQIHSTPTPSITARSKHSHGQRRRVAPTFNLMVAGAQGVGKTSLLRLLINTADISPTATQEQRTSIDEFLNANSKRTERIETACLEICESRFDRVLLSVIDTPGLDFHEGRELKLERQVSSIVKYLDLQYADTMDEESKVIRKSKGDQHVHLCIYMIDPESIMTASARRQVASVASQDGKDYMLAPIEPVVLTMDQSISEVEATATDGNQDRLTMNPAELRVIHRLSGRVNVLPIIARSDVLTDENLAEVKATIRRELHESGLGFTVFGPASVPEETKVTTNGVENDSVTSANGAGTNGRSTDEGLGDEESEDEDEDERQSRRVVKLSQGNRRQNRSSSRSRLEQVAFDDKREPVQLEATDPESLAAVRFSSAHYAKHSPQLVDLMPFAVIMPEKSLHDRRGGAAPSKAIMSTLRPSSSLSLDSSAPPQSPVTQEGTATTEGDYTNEDGGVSTRAAAVSTPTPASVMSPVSVQAGAAAPLQPPLATENRPYPPRSLIGSFVRRFRWGVVDVLNPEHCDYAALRTAIFSTHFKMLKMNTKEVLYEKYRTEKLLARRVTRNISEDERRRLLQDLGF